MNEEVKKNLSDSANDFNDIVWPVIKNWFGEGELISVQDVTDFRMAQLLDTCSGIDAWYVETTKGIRGIGSRVQWTENDHKKNYKTFTIRKELFSGGRTEYEKLCNELVEDGSNLSRIRYQNMINTQYKEEIHVNLSFSFLLKYLAYFLIGVSFLAIATQSLIFGSVVLILSVGSYLFHKYFLGKTKISYMGYKMAPEFLKLLFA